MNALVMNIVAGVVCLCAGCAGLRSSGNRCEYPAFTEGEIRSKSWNETGGKHLQMLSWTLVQFENRQKLLVVGYGDSAAGLTNCLEFYHVRQHGTEVLPSSTVFATNQQVVLPEGKEFILIHRDCGNGNVTSVVPYELKGQAGLTITRRIELPELKKAEGLRYNLRYTRDSMLARDLQIGTWDASSD